MSNVCCSLLLSLSVPQKKKPVLTKQQMEANRFNVLQDIWASGKSYQPISLAHSGLISRASIQRRFDGLTGAAGGYGAVLDFD